MLLSYEIRHESTTVNKDSSLLWCPGSPHESSTITLDSQHSECSSTVWELDMYLLKLTLINTHHFLTGFSFIRKNDINSSYCPSEPQKKAEGWWHPGALIAWFSSLSSSELQAAFSVQSFHSTFPIFLLGTENFNVLLFCSFQSISGLSSLKFLKHSERFLTFWF